MVPRGLRLHRLNILTQARVHPSSFSILCIMASITTRGLSSVHPTVNILILTGFGVVLFPTPPPTSVSDTSWLTGSFVLYHRLELPQHQLPKYGTCLKFIVGCALLMGWVAFGKSLYHDFYPVKEEVMVCDCEGICCSSKTRFRSRSTRRTCGKGTPQMDR